MWWSSSVDLWVRNKETLTARHKFAQMCRREHKTGASRNEPISVKMVAYSTHSVHDKSIQVLIRKSEEKIPCGSSRLIWEVNIKIYYVEV
jgi:hypothetical protein